MHAYRKHYKHYTTLQDATRHYRNRKMSISKYINRLSEIVGMQAPGGCSVKNATLYIS